MWDRFFDNYLLLLMVFTRMSGMLLFNPLLGKKNVPAFIKMGLALCIAVIITPTLSGKTMAFTNTMSFLLAAGKELFIGFCVSYLLSMFLSSALMAGELIDMQLGVGMSRIYDPQSNVSMPLSGTIYNIMFSLMFFISNGHLTLIKIIALSFNILPPGPGLINLESGGTVILLFANFLVLAVKMAIPIMTIELLCEAGMGVLMRTVPQINVFVIGLQLKLLVGLFIIILLLPGTSTMIDAATDHLFTNMQQLLSAMA